ncbi:NUDIX hydrolase [Tepidicaulis sp.]|jgi:8-oxo-dGTP pyrophosphatase MutT (NUDIX family)|uniref:NUDIX hydrolase n=1 Tax=Tepidicaulis sp. TaxID=1920809 RepID=UPI003B5C0040
MDLRQDETRSGEREPLRQAGAVPYAVREGHVLFLLITSSSGRWIFPKGHIEEGERSAQAASREAFEEAGVVGEVLDKALICFDVSLERKGGRRDGELCLYPMRVAYQEDKWPDRGGRHRHWVTLNELAELVDDERYVEAARAIVAAEEVTAGQS